MANCNTTHTSRTTYGPRPELPSDLEYAHDGNHGFLHELLIWAHPCQGSDAPQFVATTVWANLRSNSYGTSIDEALAVAS